MEIGIVGGGLTGLTAAYRLAKKDHEVTIYEKEEKLGGLARGFEIGGEAGTLDRYYHHIFKTDDAFLNLIEDLGLSDSLKWHRAKMGFYADGSTYDFGTPISLLKFSPLSWPAKIRFGLATLYLQNLTDWQNLEDITVVEWMKKYAGKETYDVIWGPLLKSKFGENYDRIPMSWMWGRIKQRESSTSLLGAEEELGYMEGGFQTLIDKLESVLNNQEVKIETGKEVKGIRPDNGRIEVVTNSVKAKYDKVINTAAIPVFLKIAQGLPGEYRKRLSSIDYFGAMSLIFSLKNSISDYYWMNIGNEKFPFTGLIEHTNFASKSSYQGRNLVYTSKYLHRDDPMMGWDKSKLLEEYTTYIKKVNPKFSSDWIEEIELFRSQFAQPITRLNYSDINPELETPIDGLYLATMAQIYPWDRGMNYAIKIGNGFK